MANPDLVIGFDTNDTNTTPVTTAKQTDGFLFGETISSAVHNELFKQLFAAANKNKNDGVWEWEDPTIIDPTTEYNTGSIVSNDGSIFISLIDTNEVEPINDGINWVCVDETLLNAVLKTGNQTIAGIKTFSSSPIVPTPTAGTHAANKAYVDNVATLDINSLTNKTTPVDTDNLALQETGGLLKKVSFKNLKAFIGGGVDYTATTNPLVTTNPQNDGAIWNNYSSGEIFVCTDKTIGANKWIGTNGTTVPAPATANLFGRIWNIADDVYKRVGLDFAKFSNATQAEFDTWLSPTAERVNDEDTFTPSDLTTELDTNPNLPFGFMKRKVVTNLGVVTDFDHATLPSATQQIMTVIPKTHFADFVVVSGGKWYDVKLASMQAFSVDVKKDLGFSVVDEIKVWNPTAGISSGTVLGDVVISALNPAFVHNDDREIDETFIGSFWSISGRSTFGAKATANITLPTARTQHTAFGADFNQHHYFNNALIQLLAYIERGSNYLEQSGTKWDGYSWHTGATSYPHNNGLTLSLQNKTGVVKDASNRVIANSYRGIENYHSGLWVWIDGININSGVVHLAKVGSAYVSDTAAAPYFDSGYVSTTHTGWQNIEKWQVGTFIPDATAGGTTASKVSDQMYGNTGWRALLFGGHLLRPGISGLSCWSGTYPASYSHWHIVSRASFSKFKNQP